MVRDGETTKKPAVTRVSIYLTELTEFFSHGIVEPMPGNGVRSIPVRSQRYAAIALHYTRSTDRIAARTS